MIKYLGMMKPMVAGDMALYQLIQRRYEQLGIGGEIYPQTPTHFRELKNYLPAGQISLAHLPYHLNVREEEHFAQIVEYAEIGGVRGFTLHERRSYLENHDEFLACLEKLSKKLSTLNQPPAIFIEFVSANTLDDYYHLMANAVQIPHIFPCLDVGHIAVDYCREILTRLLPNTNQDELSPESPDLPKMLDAIQQAVKQTLTPTFAYLREFAALKLAKWHFHLHDAHPLSRLSPYPIRDHLSYLQAIKLPFNFRGNNFLAGIFSVLGAQELRKVISEFSGELSVMLEIHAQNGRVSLADDGDLFAHWHDVTNAEIMNYHLQLVSQCLTIMK